jgi:uracil-DNA glycosylase
VSLSASIPASWREAVGGQADEPYFAELDRFVAAQRAEFTVYPPQQDVFAALEATALRDVRVVLIGQDPYHGPGQAHGLCFSVRPGVKVPPSLRNIYKELQTDLGVAAPAHGCLTPWARRGVLMLNTVLTVRQAEPGSHAGHGWETFTDAVIRAVAEREQPAVFILWGAHAKKKAKLVDASRHRIVQGAHPSPLSARMFLGSRPFSAVDAALEELGYAPMDWSLPADAAEAAGAQDQAPVIAGA